MTSNCPPLIQKRDVEDAPSLTFPVRNSSDFPEGGDGYLSAFPSAPGLPNAPGVRALLAGTDFAEGVATDVRKAIEAATETYLADSKRRYDHLRPELKVFLGWPTIATELMKGSRRGYCFEHLSLDEDINSPNKGRVIVVLKRLSDDYITHIYFNREYK